MGISGLFKQCEFELFSDKIHSLLEQKLSRIGIDMYVLLHKFCIDVEIATILVNEPTTFCQPLYEKIKNWLINLINLGFDLYLVYDGTTMKYKVTEEERAMRRAIALAKGDMVGAVEIVPEQMYNLQHFLADLDLPYVVAPFEADAQLAWMFKNDYVDMVLTCDSDLIIYGVSRVIFIKPGKNELEWYEHKKIDEKETPQTINELPLDHLWLFGYLVGCDYFKGVPSIGIVKAFKLVRDITYVMTGSTIDWEETYKKLYQSIEQNVTKKAREKLDVEMLRQAYDKVRYIYTHQPIFVPESWQFKYLTNEEIPEEKKEEFGKVWNLVDHATGKINPIENKPFELIETQCC